MDDSYAQSSARGYISFAADRRKLDTIPPYPAAPFHVNSTEVASLAAAKNFLYLFNSELFSSKEDFLEVIRDTDYDIVIIYLFFNGGDGSCSDPCPGGRGNPNGVAFFVILRQQWILQVFSSSALKKKWQLHHHPWLCIKIIPIHLIRRLKSVIVYQKPHVVI